jgi:hypothetical protein
MPINNLIQFRKGNSSDWLSTNPILASGEPGYDSTNNILKIGDGITTWSLLSQISSSDIYVYAKNATGGPLTKGQAVYISGAQGDHPVLALASAASETSSSKTLGLLKQNLDNNEFGYVVTEGVLNGLNTDSAGSAGDSVWLSPSTPGGLVYGLTNKPYAPNHMVFIGYVLRKNSNNGSIYIKVQNGYELEELHNVAVTGVSNGQFLQYNSSSGLWVGSSSGNFSTLSINGTGVSINGHTHTVSQITDFNSGVSGLLPVKNIVAGTGIFLSSSDGSFTINATGVTGGSSLNTEDVMDIIGTGIIGGTGISVSYDDTNGSVSVNLYASAITGYEILSTTKDTFSVSPNYLVGNLSVYYNGFKLLYGEDYTATDGSTFVLSNPGSSGDVVEWAGLGGPAQYASLTHSHGNITNSGSLGSTSGLVLVTKSGGAIDVGSGLYYDSNKLGIGTNSLSGVLSLSNGYFNSDGDSKQTLLTLRNTTSNDSTTTLYTDGSSSKLVLPVSGVWNFNINLTCLSISNSGAAGWNFRGCIKRNSSTTALVGSIIEENFIDSSLNGVAATVVANTGTSSLDINVNGLVSNNIRWTAATNLVQTYYG